MQYFFVFNNSIIYKIVEELSRKWFKIFVLCKFGSLGVFLTLIVNGMNNKEADKIEIKILFMEQNFIIINACV